MSQSTDAWLAFRRAHYTGSDAAAILGCPGALRTAREIALEKRGEPALPAGASDEALFVGLAREPYLIEQTEQRTGRRVLPPDLWKVYAPRADFLRLRDHSTTRIVAKPYVDSLIACTIDGMIQTWKFLRARGGEGYVGGRLCPFGGPAPSEQLALNGPGVLEIKTNAGEAWRDGPPLHVLCQLQHNMLATGLAWGTIAVEHQGSTIRFYDIPRHEGVHRALLAAIERFHERYVLGPFLPAAGDTERDLDLLKSMHPEDDGTVGHVSPAWAGVWRKLNRLREQKLRAEKLITALDVRVRDELGKHRAARVEGTDLAFTLSTTRRADGVTFRSLRTTTRSKL